MKNTMGGTVKWSMNNHDLQKWVDRLMANINQYDPIKFPGSRAYVVRNYIESLVRYRLGAENWKRKYELIKERYDQLAYKGWMNDMWQAERKYRNKYKKMRVAHDAVYLNNLFLKERISSLTRKLKELEKIDN